MRHGLALASGRPWLKGLYPAHWASGSAGPDRRQALGVAGDGAGGEQGCALGQGQGPVAPEVPQVDDAPGRTPAAPRRAPCTGSTLGCARPVRPGSGFTTHKLQQRHPLPLRSITAHAA